MALKRIGVLFKTKNPKNLLMDGKLQIPVEILERWNRLPSIQYKEREYIEVKIGMFKNTKTEKEFYPLMEFLEDENQSATGKEEPKEDDSELPF